MARTPRAKKVIKTWKIMKFGAKKHDFLTFCTTLSWRSNNALKHPQMLSEHHLPSFYNFIKKFFKKIQIENFQLKKYLQKFLLIRHFSGSSRYCKFSKGSKIVAKWVMKTFEGAKWVSWTQRIRIKYFPADSGQISGRIGHDSNHQYLLMQSKIWLILA